MGQNLTYRPLPGSRLNMAHPMARNMCLCMLFNEQGSRAMDLSPYQANGRLHGFGSPAKRHIGGLGFDKDAPSYVEIPASFSQLDFTSEDFSIIARVKVDDLAAHRMIFCRGREGNDGYHFLISTTGFLRASTIQGVAIQMSLSAAGDIVVATDFTVGLSRIGAGIRLHKNGVDVTLDPVAHTDPTTCSRIARVGVYDNKTSYPFDGKMEFLYIYRNRALTEFEHKAVHEQPYTPMGYNLFL